MNLLKNLSKIYILCVRKLRLRKVKSVARVTQIERPMLGAELDYSTNQALKPCHTAYSNCQACLDRQLLRGVSGGNTNEQRPRATFPVSRAGHFHSPCSLLPPSHPWPSLATWLQLLHESILYVCIYIYIYIYVCMYVHVHTHTHVLTLRVFILKFLQAFFSGPLPLWQALPKLV